MYDLYKRNCIENESSFVKSSYYRFIFNTWFNIEFHVPKTDRCERCQDMKIKRKEGINITNEEQELHDAHIVREYSMRKEKDNYKSKIHENELIIVYDLENVINLPKAEVGSCFYKRKLNLYNLTTITSDKQGYCAIWIELTSDRVRDDISSAFSAILKKIVTYNPNKTEFICWSDSCIPQNRNSHIPQAILEFLHRIRSIKSVTLKYSTASHSCVQEVNNMHQKIEEAMFLAEFYSPVSFLGLLLKVNQNQPYHVIQIGKNNFKDFMNSSKTLHFNRIPYSKVSQIKLILPTFIVLGINYLTITILL